MKKVVLFITLLLFSFNSFGQKVVDVKEEKDYKWGISNEFHSEPGFTGSYWHTAMRVICTEDYHFMLSIYKPASNGYYAIHEDEDCYLKLENDSIVTLKLNTEFSPWNYERAGYYTGSVYMPKRYFTQTFYDIPDVRILTDFKVVKIRWIIDGAPYDIDYAKNSWVGKFNKRLKNAILQAQKDFEKKAKFTDDNLSGF